MKTTIVTLLAAAAAQQAAAHATFQQLWVNGVDKAGTCVRAPGSNSPVTNLNSNDMRCNAGAGKAAAKCAVAAGTTVTVEMHQQAGDRSCSSPAIGGAHYGPVIVYMSKVADSATADGSSGWFKVFQDGWSKVGNGPGDADNWGVKNMEKNCGKVDVKVPADIAAGDYLLRAEVIALHAASPSGGAQLYMSCYQLSVTGGGSASPPTVVFPGAYKQSDAGIGLSIHAPMTSYVVPGPAVYGGGAGAGSPAPPPPPPASSPSPPQTTLATSARPVTAAPAPSGPAGCTAAKYAQCGGTGFTGCTTCAAGSTCKASGTYYSQCL